MMRQMLLTRSIGSYIHIQPPGGAEDRRYDKTNAAPVVIVPAYGNFDGNIHYFWAVIGWSKEDVAGNVSTPQYTSNYTVAVGERTVYILTLDRGAYRPQDAYIAYRNAEGNVQVTLWPPTQDTCYDLTPSTINENNAAIREAVGLLNSVRFRGIAPRVSGGVITGHKLSLATAANGDVLQGKTFYSGDKDMKTGTMTNRGSWGTTISPGGSVTVPNGYHSGGGKVTAKEATLNVVNLGNVSCLNSPGTLNVRSVLPSMYNKLTTSNFFVEPYQSVINVNNPSVTNMWVWTFSKSYDPNTGILTIPMMAQNVVPDRLGAGLQSVTVYAVYVK